MHRKKLINKLDLAEIQYKLALAVSARCHGHEEAVFSYLDVFSYGKHTVEKTELMLNKNQEELASVLLEHSATYIMMMQLNSVLEEVWPNRLQHRNDNIRNASQITRLIRNAFAHDPFEPIWEIKPKWDNHIFEIKDVIKLSTDGLNGKKVKRMDYGGPLALLRLLQFVRNLLIENVTH